MQKKELINNKEVGQRIRSSRMMNNLTQENLGDILGITSQAVQKIESGENSININYLVIICQVLKTTPDYILYGIERSERDVEMSFETMTGNEKMHLLLRLLMYVSKVDNVKYKEMLDDIIRALEEEK